MWCSQPCQLGGTRGGLRDPVIDHPAPLEAERRIDLAALGPVIAVAELVLADEFAVEPRPQLGAESLAVPPSEHPQQEVLHRPIALLVNGQGGVDAIRAVPVQASAPGGPE